jgi:hypothetical protein
MYDDEAKALIWEVGFGADVFTADADTAPAEATADGGAGNIEPVTEFQAGFEPPAAVPPKKPRKRKS